MAVTRITGTKWLVKDNIQGGTAAGQGQIAADTINTYNMADGAITPAKIDSTASYTVGSLTSTGDVTADGALNGTTVAVGTNGTEFTIDASGNVVIAGDLTVNGDNIIANTTTLTVEDKNIVIAKGGTAATANGAGVTVEITDGTNGSIVYDSTSASKFAVGAEGAEDDVVTATVTQTLTNKTYDIVGADIVGEADIESALRTLAGVVGGSGQTLYTDASAVSGGNLTVAGASTIDAVYVSGIRMSEGAGNDYTVAGNVITFLEAPLAGMNIVVDYKGN